MRTRDYLVTNDIINFSNEIIEDIIAKSNSKLLKNVYFTTSKRKMFDPIRKKLITIKIVIMFQQSTHFHGDSDIFKKKQNSKTFYARLYHPINFHPRILKSNIQIRNEIQAILVHEISHCYDFILSDDKCRNDNKYTKQFRLLRKQYFTNNQINFSILSPAQHYSFSVAYLNISSEITARMRETIFEIQNTYGSLPEDVNNLVYRFKYFYNKRYGKRYRDDPPAYEFLSIKNKKQLEIRLANYIASYITDNRLIGQRSLRKLMEESANIIISQNQSIISKDQQIIDLSLQLRKQPSNKIIINSNWKI